MNLQNPWINYHHLFYFKTIVEEGSVSKAAEKLLIGQPTLSAQLKQFEDNLQVKLFEREHKKLIITEQGKIAYQYAQNIFKLGNEMFQSMHDRLIPQRPSLVIAAIDSIPKQVILKLAQFALKNYQCQISLIEGHPEELVREVLNHKVDILITDHLPLNSDSLHLSHRVLSKNTVSVYGAKTFLHLKKKFPASISLAPIILPTHDSKLRYDLEHWAHLTQINFDIVAEGQDIAVKKLMASEGIGLITTGKLAVSKLIKSKELYELGEVKGVYEEIHLLTAKRKVEHPISSSIFKDFSIA